MAKSKSKSKSSSSKSSKSKKRKGKKKKKSQLDVQKNDQIKEKPYITKEIETSITLLESPENGIVLEALLFLSKYADIKRNNLNFIQAHGLVPKVLALLDHNICILRVALRLLSFLLTTNAALQEIRQEQFDVQILKIAHFYVSHKDELVKEYSSLILSSYTNLDRAEILLNEPELIKAILKTIKSPENDVILNSSLELFRKFIEYENVRKSLPQEPNFDLEIFMEHMQTSDQLMNTVMGIFEKLTYFSDDEMMIKVRECNLVEVIFTIILDPEKKKYMLKCLNIVNHCMLNENTNSYFVQTLEFLQFCQWVKTCPSEGMYLCARIFKKLSEIDDIKQMLFDLNVEDTILSLLRTEDKQILNLTFEAIANMSRHRYCCEKILTPIVIKTILKMLQGPGDAEDPHNEIALTTLHHFARRDARTIHMIQAYGGLEILLDLLKTGTEKMSRQAFRKLLEMLNMFVTNNQLQKFIYGRKLYEGILKQNQSGYDEICVASLELAVNCTGQSEFRQFFLDNDHTQFILDKLMQTSNEDITKVLVIFIHGILIYPELGLNFINAKVLPLLKDLDIALKERIPLIERVINRIYDMCLPLKFFETERLDMTDKVNGLFYIVTGKWKLPFPCLEVLELRKISTKCTIYIVNLSESCCPDMKKLCILYPDENFLDTECSELSVHVQCAIHFGKVSHDPYLINYIGKVRRLLRHAKKIEERVRIVANFVDEQLCGPEIKPTMDKMHTFKMHMQCLKEKLGTNMIPIGYLRLGFHCERALLFKTLADQVCIPTTLVKGEKKLYWNEIALLEKKSPASGGGRGKLLRMYVVDLMNNVGKLLPQGSRECNAYCQPG